MKTLLPLLVVLVALPLPADEVLLPIAGSAGSFRTDARFFNPSFSETITVDAYLLPVGNTSNSGATPVTISVGPREMKIYDDVVSSLFQATGLAAIRLVSASDLGATARIYAQTDAGTLGQFVVGVPLGSALTKGVLLQLKSSAAFRTNVGLMNTDGAAMAAVTLKLYDKTNTRVATATQTMSARAVIAPTNIMSLFGSPSGDLSDCWVSFESDKPVVAYGSVVDNATTDPTFVPAMADTGVIPPPQPTVKEFKVEAFQFDYTVTPTGGSPIGDSFTVNKGDQVRLILTAKDNGIGSGHGFSLGPFVTSRTLKVNQQTVVEFTASQTGTFTFFCTVVCGGGHSGMSGTMTVEP